MTPPPHAWGPHACGVRALAGLLPGYLRAGHSFHAKW
ncbi:hypothetical protein SNOUR_03715 [Streptomyces noursei ATCC 11455]|nr:hypothetical protein SNOUR_03715 [Streptomyces noursei ATCC 11455]